VTRFAQKKAPAKRYVEEATLDHFAGAAPYGPRSCGGPEENRREYNTPERPKELGQLFFYGLVGGRHMVRSGVTPAVGRAMDKSDGELILPIHPCLRP